MITLIEIFLKSFLLGFLIVNFEPLKWILDIIFVKETFVKAIIYLLIGCIKCCSFWVSLIISGFDIWISSGVYFIVSILDNWLIGRLTGIKF